MSKIECVLIIAFLCMMLACAVKPVVDLNDAENVIQTYETVNEGKTGEVYKMQYSTGINRYYRILPVSKVSSDNNITTYEVIGDGNITIKDGIAKWTHINGDIESISNVAITKAK